MRTKQTQTGTRSRYESNGSRSKTVEPADGNRSRCYSTTRHMCVLAEITSVSESKIMQIEFKSTQSPTGGTFWGKCSPTSHQRPCVWECGEGGAVQPSCPTWCHPQHTQMIIGLFLKLLHSQPWIKFDIKSTVWWNWIKFELKVQSDVLMTTINVSLSLI